MVLNERRVHFLASSICNGIRDTIHALLRKSRPPESFMSREDFQSFFESYRQWGAELDIEHNPRHPDWVKRVMYALDLTFRLHSSHFKKIGEDELSRPSWLPSPAFSNTKLFPVAKLYGFLIPDEEELAELAPPPPDDTELLVESLMADETPPPPSSLLASATRQSDSAQLPPKKRAKIEKTTPSTTTSQPSKVQPTRKSKVDMVSKLHGQRTSTPSSSISTRHTQSAPVKKRPQMASVSVPTGSKRKAVDSQYDSDFNDDPDISVTSNGEDEKDEQSDFEEDEEPNPVKKSKASKGKAKATTKTTARKAPAKTNAAKEIADAERDIEDVTPTRNPCNSCSLGPHGSGGCPGEEGKGKRPVDSDKTTRGEPVLSITIDEDVNMEPTAGSSASGNSSKGTSASQRATTVSIPYSMVPGMDTSSQPYRRAQYFLMQAVLNAKVTSKRARVTDSVDVRTPSAADAERSSGTYSRRLLEDVALLPFAELKSKPSDTLKALANFLLVQIDQSLFQAHRALAEYKTSQTLRAEALRVLLERADISQDAAEAPILGAEGVSAASASIVQPFQPST
ncbi:hypothetical protein VKT23_003922 [Stygiomarasmius scandens]|uniref:Uncharacterized protein n=1 Tax=Marasmiellus scandens TaxID=2682957 RepID=A0ABR1JSJ4_9AGAR